LNTSKSTDRPSTSKMKTIKRLLITARRLPKLTHQMLKHGIYSRPQTTQQVSSIPRSSQESLEIMLSCWVSWVERIRASLRIYSFYFTENLVTNSCPSCLPKSSIPLRMVPGLKLSILWPKTLVKNM